MKLKFKKQAFQTRAVEAVADCFAGQPKSGTIQYRVDPGRAVEAGGQAVVAPEQAGFKNAELAFAPAIAFQEGKVKHVYFVAETKGSMSSMQLRSIEHSKIQCARKFFANITSDEVKYDVVDSYGKLMDLVK